MTSKNPGCAAAALSALLVGACSAGPALENRPVTRSEVSFEGRGLLVLSDADMAGTAYADGRLHPIDAADTLSLIAPGELRTVAASATASNSVMGWPGGLDVSPDGRFAYVVETRAAAPAGVSVMDGGVYTGMPVGRLLTTIDISDLSRPQLVSTIDVGEGPTSIHVAPDGRFALVSLKDRQTPIAVVLLENGAPTRVLALSLPLAAQARREIDEGALFVRLAPNGRDFMFNVANTHVQFARLAFDDAGAPTGAELVGAAVQVGRWLTMARWANDGRHLIVADVGWSENQLGAVLNGPGSLISIAFDQNGAHRVVATARVSLSPEGFDINRAGDLIVAVNMERSYLPERLPYTLFGRREFSSLSLVAYDERTGELTPADGPVAFSGVLPEDAVFDASGDTIAVAVFHEKAASPQAGWVEYFDVDRSGETPRVRPTGVRTPTVRGAHDLVLVP